MLGLGLLIVAFAMVIYALMTIFAAGGPTQHALGVGAIGGAIGIVGYVLIHMPTIFTSIIAALDAIFIWNWWNKGGGSGTKRKLRKLARKFKPVRRTAPSMG
jgi:membrane protein implicated in regulation of membrane protease activity